METPAPDSLFGITLHERYILGKRLHGGTSTNVHAAHDLGTERTVTVTVMHPWLVEDDDAVQAFLRRAQALEGLSDPGLAGVLGHGRDGEYVYAVGEYPSGRTLAETLDEDGGGSRYEPHAALTIVAGVLAALDAAHRADVVHGDIGPDGIVVDEEGGARITGFPLVLDADAAPEPHTDVRAVGWLLYTMLTGVVVSPQTHPPRPSFFVPGLASDLDALVASATDPRPHSRPQDAGRYLALVERALRELSGPSPEEGAEGTQPVPVVVEASVPHQADAPEEGEGRTQSMPVVVEASVPHQADTPEEGGEGTRPVPVVAEVSAPHQVGASEERSGERSTPVPPWRRTPLLVGAGVLVLALFAVGWFLLPDDRAVLSDLVGVSTEEAEERLAALELDLRVRFDETYSDTVDTGAVADSTPAPGSEVERGEEVLLWVSAGPRHVEVPDVVGGTENEARETLREAGFVETEVVQEHSAEHPPGTVLSTEPAVGEDGDREEPVVLHVSEGVIVPTLVGMTGEEASAALDELGLTAEVVQEHHDTVPVGEVSGQSPEPGTILPEEGTATLTVSSGPAPEEQQEAAPPEEPEAPQEEASCDVAEWDPGVVYEAGDRVSFQGREYEARWYIQGFPPTTVEEWGVWEDRGPC